MGERHGGADLSVAAAVEHHFGAAPKDNARASTRALQADRKIARRGASCKPAWHKADLQELKVRPYWSVNTPGAFVGVPMWFLPFDRIEPPGLICSWPALLWNDVRLKIRTTPEKPVPPANTPNCLLLVASLSTTFISAPAMLVGKTTMPLRVLFEAVLLDTVPNELPSKRIPCVFLLTVVR